MNPNISRNRKAFTINEVLVSLVIAGLGLSGTVSAYVLSAKRAEWQLCSSAAQGLAIQRLEQARAAKWDLSTSPATDELVAANFPTLITLLEIPQTSGNSVQGTVTTSISSISTSPAIRLVRVDCIWSLWYAGPFTNSVFAFRSPVQQ